MTFENILHCGDATDIPGLARSCFWCPAYIPQRLTCGEHRVQFPPEGYCTKGGWDVLRLALALKLRAEDRGPLIAETEPSLLPGERA